MPRVPGTDRPTEADEIYFVQGPGGFTETFNHEQVRTLVAMGLIEYEKSDHVMTIGGGSDAQPYGPIHHFYRKAP